MIYEMLMEGAGNAKTGKEICKVSGQTCVRAAQRGHRACIYRRLEPHLG